MDAGVYIHVPFCQVRCSYCDFNTYAGLAHLQNAYVESLCREVRQHAILHLPPPAEPVTARTLYLGGGTPSLLSAAQIEAILAACRDSFALAPAAEITVEANPGTISLGALRALRRLGVNRLSLGVQSFDDAVLRLLDRLHTAAQALEALRAAGRAGFDNISLDFMYGLPGQTLDHWRATLARAIALRPSHLSLYALTLEEHVPMAARVRSGDLPLPGDDDVADMYALAEDMLDAAGYLHYEISNWSSAPDTQARHNSIYWRRQPYLGFGAGAHSLVAGRRYANVRHPRDYIERIGSGVSPEDESEVVSARSVMAETMFLGLRLLHEGVTAGRFLEHTGQPLAIFSRQIAELQAQGLLDVVGERVTLSRRGRFLSNQVFTRFLE